MSLLFWISLAAAVFVIFFVFVLISWIGAIREKVNEIIRLESKKMHVVTEFGSGVVLNIAEAEWMILKGGGWYDREDTRIYFRKGYRPEADYAEYDSDGKVKFYKNLEAKEVKKIYG